MKFSAFAGLAVLVTQAFAFPAYLNDLEKVKEIMARDGFKNIKRQPQVFPPVIPGRKLIPDSAHPYRAPGPTDQRSPCPGLNSMANHGYISRTGITSSQELAWGMQEAFALGPDLAEFLGVLSIAVDGNPVLDRVSIGGPDARVPGLLGGTLPGGIGRHNAYEIDSSLTRNDYYFGQDFRVNGTLYENMFKVADRLNGGALNQEVMNVYRNQRYFESKATNPQFQFVPIGVLFFGADQFNWRTLVSTGPDGKNVPATRSALASTYGAKSNGDGTWTYVPERFPAEWYRSSVPYTIPEIVAGAVSSLAYAAAHGPALPTGFDPARASDPAYVACNMQKVLTAQVPSALLGLPLISQGLASISNSFAQYGC